MVSIANDLIAQMERMSKNLHKVLARLEEKHLTLRAEKCTFGMNRVVFMGILLSRHGIGPTEEKVCAMVEASHPTSVSEVRGFLGLVGFSARFIPDFATTAEPFRALCRKGENCEWGKEQETAL